jgi:hypothetical protein
MAFESLGKAKEGLGSLEEFLTGKTPITPDTRHTIMTLVSEVFRSIFETLGDEELPGNLSKFLEYIPKAQSKTLTDTELQNWLREMKIQQGAIKVRFRGVFLKKNQEEKKAAYEKKRKDSQKSVRKDSQRVSLSRKPRKNTGFISLQDRIESKKMTREEGLRSFLENQAPSELEMRNFLASIYMITSYFRLRPRVLKRPLSEKMKKIGALNEEIMKIPFGDKKLLDELNFRLSVFLSQETREEILSSARAFQKDWNKSMG